MRKNQRVIHLDDMLKYIMKQWKILLIGCILVGCVFGVLGIYKVHNKYTSSIEKEQRIEVNVSGTDLDDVQAVLGLEKAIETQREYNKNSLMMRIDPNDIKMCSLTYQFHVSDDISSQLQESKLVQGVKAFQNALNNEHLYDYIRNELSQEIEAKYFKELITTDTDAPGVIIYLISAENENMALKISQGIKKYLAESNNEILGKYSGLSATVVSEQLSTSVNQSMILTQTNNHVNLQNLNGTLNTRLSTMSEKAKQYLELARTAMKDGDFEPGQPLYKEVSDKSNVSVGRKIYEVLLYAFYRVIVFFAVLLIICAAKYMWSRRLMCADDLKDMYGVRVINVVNLKDENRIDLISEKIALLMGENRKLIMSGSNISNDVCISILEKVKYKLVSRDFEVTITDQIMTSEILSKLKSDGELLLFEKIDHSTYAGLDDFIYNIKNFELNPLGVVVLE